MSPTVPAGERRDEYSTGEIIRTLRRVEDQQARLDSKLDGLQASIKDGYVTPKDLAASEAAMMAELKIRDLKIAQQDREIGKLVKIVYGVGAIAGTQLLNVALQFFIPEKT